MHPEVVSPVPGDCPICNMALIPAGEHEHMAMAAGGEIVATAEQRVVAEQLRAAAWLGADGEGTAVLYKDDLVGLAADEPSLFFGGSSPNMGIDAQLVPGSQLPIDSSTVNVRRLDRRRLAPSRHKGAQTSSRSHQRGAVFRERPLRPRRFGAWGCIHEASDSSW
jgi:hypothetical protein